MKLSDQQINEISEELECGMRTYLNIETNEIKTVLDWDDCANDEFWEEEMKKIEDSPDKFIEFYKMDSAQGLRVMQDFVETVEDDVLRKKLESGLRLSKPFRNFKNIIDDENEFCRKWLDFKHTAYVDFVREQLLSYNEELDGEV